MTSVGMYLGDDEDNDILLPNKYVPDDLKEEDEIEVFVYTDSEDRLGGAPPRPDFFLIGTSSSFSATSIIVLRARINRLASCKACYNSALRCLKAVTSCL